MTVKDKFIDILALFIAIIVVIVIFSAPIVTLLFGLLMLWGFIEINLKTIFMFLFGGICSIILIILTLKIEVE